MNYLFYEKVLRKNEVKYKRIYVYTHILYASVASFPTRLMLVHNLQPKWYFLNSLMVAFSAGERPVVAEGSPPLWDRGPSKGNF